MTCASCVALIESRLMQRPGVLNVAVGLLAERAEIDYDKARISPADIVEAVQVYIDVCACVCACVLCVLCVCA